MELQEPSRKFRSAAENPSKDLTAEIAESAENIFLKNQIKSIFFSPRSLRFLSQ
jgi:hypothetical protein